MKILNHLKKANFNIPLISQENWNYFPGTSCVLLEGKLVASLWHEQCAQRGKDLPSKPCLAVILVGENPASEIYVNHKIKTFQKIGYQSLEYRIPSSECSEENLINLIESLSKNQKVHGILVQLPLPKHINEQNILSKIPSSKDADGFSAESIGKLTLGLQGTYSCTPFGVMALLASYGISCEGKRAVVVGRSNIVGKPMSLMLLHENATVTMAHSRTQDLPSIVQQADIIVAAVGIPHLITPSMCKEGVIVVDIGMNRLENKKLVGDVHPDVSQKASFMTPVPGGVGPLTIAMLAVNTFLSSLELSSKAS